MESKAQLFALIAPVFFIVAVGWMARRLRWLTPEADDSLLRLVINILYPCLIFHSVLGNPALRNSSNVIFPPLVGFFTIALGFGLGYLAGRALGLESGRGLRTFAFAVGVFNYGYIPIPLVQDLFGKGTLGVLFVHNMGCEAAIWTIGILLLAGGNNRGGWKKLINPPVISIIVALTANGLGFGNHLPSVVTNVLSLLGACAIPVGLLLIGATVEGCLEDLKTLAHPRVMTGAALMRLGVLPVLFLLLARFAPVSPELKRIMVIQAAMPAGVMPIVIARHYQGNPLTAVQVIVATTLVGLFTIPVWIHAGFWFVGVH